MIETSALRFKPIFALDRLFAILLGILFILSLAYTSKEVGVPRDESIYFYAGDQFANWFEKAVSGQYGGFWASFSQKNIDEGFKINHEHPMLMKSLFGLSHRYLHQKWQWIEDPILAYRLPSMILAGLCVFFTFLLSVRLLNRWVGLFAALALMTQPHFFFHAHLSCFDLPVTAFWLIITYAYILARQSIKTNWFYIAMAGVTLGLGLATKLNAFFAPFTLLAVSFYHLYHVKLSKNQQLWQTFKKRYWHIGISMVLLGLLVFILHWPWLYHDTLFRWGAYIGFHARHEHYAVDFFDHLYYRPPFPVYFPFAMSLFTLPMGVLLLGTIGTVYMVYLAYQRWQTLRQTSSLLDDQSAQEALQEADQKEIFPWEVLILANLFVPFLVIAMPNTPIFGGTKHWMPAMPFLCICAGLSFYQILHAFQSLSFQSFSNRSKVLLSSLLLAIFIVPAAIDTKAYGSRGAMFYNELIGGIPGAAEVRLPRNFWGYSTIDALPILNQKAENRALVFWHKATNLSIHQYQRAKLLRSDIQYTGDWTGAYSNWAVYHDQREKKHEEVDLWRFYGNPFPYAGVFVDGVQMVGIYHR